MQVVAGMDESGLILFELDDDGDLRVFVMLLLLAEEGEEEEGIMSCLVERTSAVE
jgi:hypothetical protein